jgi:hypothetical protein
VAKAPSMKRRKIAVEVVVQGFSDCYEHQEIDANEAELQLIRF